jgi:hypothetical protein
MLFLGGGHVVETAACRTRAEILRN